MWNAENSTILKEKMIKKEGEEKEDKKEKEDSHLLGINTYISIIIKKTA